MAKKFKITSPCPVCGGDGTRLVWTGKTDEEGNFLPPDPQPCLECESGRQTIGEIEIPQLDNILDKVNDILDKVNDIFEKINE